MTLARRIVPIARHFQIDPIHLGVIFIANSELDHRKLTAPEFARRRICESHENATMLSHSGATVNGERSKPWPMAPSSDPERH